ncbi:MAG: helix-turn-helix transcriptional regulator [Bradyrhizobium sp.]|nr:helix-turn-helix transcriptional regulator [Bradyrhizobium sp.]
MACWRRALEWLRLTSHFMIEETRHPRPGSAMVVTRLLHLLFAQSVREQAAGRPSKLGWMSGLIDPQIGRALSAIHTDPARRWSVADLAGIARLSRSAFAERFVELVGVSPLRYVTVWRLDLAADHLRSGSASISQIAHQVGYGSEAALTRAFKARFKATPAQFRRRRNSVLRR